MHTPRQSCTHAVVIHLLESLVTDGALKDDTLERVGFVTGHQLNTDHLSFPYSHVTEHLRAGRKRWRCQILVPPPTPYPDLVAGRAAEITKYEATGNLSTREAEAGGSRF